MNENEAPSPSPILNQTQNTAGSPTGKKIPTSVKVISVLFFIAAALFLLGGVGMLLGGGALSVFLVDMPIESTLGSAVFYIIGSVLIAIGALYIFIGVGLWKGKAWARIVAIIFSVLGVLMAAMGVVGGDVSNNIFSLIINGYIGGYLIFNKEAKAAFV